MSALLARLMTYTLGKPGATPEEFGGVTLLDGFLDTFYTPPDDDDPGLLLRVSTRERNALAKKYPGVEESARMSWDTKGWAWTDVPADGSVPEPLLLQLIDRSYELVLKEKDDDTRYELAQLGRNLPPRELLAELIDHFGFAKKRKQIESLVAPAVLLTTTEGKESAIPLGATKIGGRPDLPARKLRLLFQLASDGNAGMGWGDGGHLYFCARPADLKAKRFDRVDVDYQCG